METHAEEASKAVKRADRKLQHVLNAKEADYAVLEPLLEKLRVTCGNAALLNYITNKPAEPIEKTLWDAHVRVKGKFAAWLKTFRDNTGRKKHVEKRKAEKLFIDFTKASQRFYRAYIGRLVANFKGIPRVHEIAKSLDQLSLTAEPQYSASAEQQKLLEASCQRSIVHLGDLSRWREAEEQKNNWAPAKGYYNLALSLDPADGQCYNGHAAVAFAAGHHLEAIYYSYRAAMVTAPFALAQGNIEKESERVRALRTEASYGLMDNSGEDLVETLEKRFLAFHAHCYTCPYDFVAFQQKATDILGMIALCFQETRHGLFDQIMTQACLINIAAESLAQRGMNLVVNLPSAPSTRALREVERSCQSFFLLQRFNLMTFQALCRVLTRELGDEPPPGTNLADLTRLSSVVRRVLPLLRQYSSWLLVSLKSLKDNHFKSSRLLLAQVLKTYAQALNSLRQNIDVFSPTPVHYLLDEDRLTVEFTPFSGKVYENRYLDPATKTLKLPRQDDGTGKTFGMELAEAHRRAQDLLLDAIRLINQKDDYNLDYVPLALANKGFVALDVPDRAPPSPPPSPPKQVWRRTHQPNTSIGDLSDSATRSVSQQLPPVNANAASTASPASPARDSFKSNAKRNKKQNARKVPMVESACAPMHTASEQAIPSTLNSSSLAIGTPVSPPAPSAPLTGLDLVRQMQKSSSNISIAKRSPEPATRFAQPTRPSVFATPFTPTPFEQTQLSPRLGPQQVRSPSFNGGDAPSSAEFDDYLVRQQHEIAMRTSPPVAYTPTQDWTNYGPTPTGFDTVFRAFEKNKNRTPSPYANSHLAMNGRPAQTRSSPQASPFGVIGQSRTVMHNSPTNGQG